MVKLHRILDIDRGDYVALTRLGPVFASVAAATVVLASLSKALFLSANPISMLPWLFMGSAAITAGGSLLYVAAMGRFRLELRLAALFTLAACSLAVLRLTFPVAPRPMSVVILLWCPAIGHLAVVQTWNLASSSLPTRQGKRLLPVLAAITTAGAAVGGGLVQLLLRWGGAEDLLWLAVALLVWPLLSVRRAAAARSASSSSSQPARQADDALDDRPGDDEQRSRPTGALRSIRRSPLVAELALFVVLLQAASLLVDYQLSAELKLAFAKDEIAGFLGGFYGLSNVVVLVLTLAATSRFVRWLGIGLALSASAVCIALGSAIYLAASLTGALSTFWVIAATAFAERLGQYALTKPAVQMAFMPLPARIAERAKTLIDGVVQRLATIGVSLLLLVASLSVTSQYRLSAPAIVACAIAVWLAVRLRPHYRRAIFGALRAKRLDLDMTRYLGEGLGRGAVLEVEQRLAGSDPEDVVRALDIARGLRLRLAPAALHELAGRPDPEVAHGALRAMAALGYRPDRQLLAELLRPERATPLLRAVLQLIDDAQLPDVADLVRPLARHHDAGVASLASVLRIRAAGQAAVHALDDEIAARSPSRSPSASPKRLTGMTLAGDFARELPELLAHPSVQVRRDTVEQMGGLCLPSFVEPLIECLGRCEVREQAVAAMARYGADILPRITAGLADPEAKLVTRAGLLGVLEKLATAPAVAVLVEQARGADPTLRNQAVACLWRLARRPEAPRPDHGTLADLVVRELAVLRRYAAVEVAGGGKLSARKLFFARELDTARRQTETRVFMLLGIRYDRAALLRAHSNYDSSDQRTRSNAIELLEQHVPDGAMRAFVPLVERAEDRHGELRPRSVVYEELEQTASVAELLGQEEVWLGRLWAWATGGEGRTGAGDYSDDILDRALELTATQLFRAVGGRELLAVAAAVEVMEAAAAQWVLQQGADDRAVYLVKAGSLQLARDGEPVGVAGRGQCFGELPLLDDGPQCCAVRAMSDVELLVLPANPLSDLMVLDPALVRGLIGVLTGRLRERIETGETTVRGLPLTADKPGLARGHDRATSGASMDSLLRLRQVPLFAELDAEQLLVMADIARQVRFSRQQTIFVEGAAGRHLYVIVEGAVEVLAAGKTIAKLKTNDCFGEMAVLDRTVRCATVRAIADTTLMAMDREDFGDLLDLHPALARSILTVLADRVRASLEGR